LKTAVVIGWLAGVALILDGAPWPLAFTVPVAVTAGAVAWVRWGAGTWAGLRVAVKLRRAVKRAAKTGGSLERA
jgi:membrane protease YdiL (CAAX protease family)